jgi:hypothetical protein
MRTIRRCSFLHELKLLLWSVSIRLQSGALRNADCFRQPINSDAEFFDMNVLQ